MAMRILRNRDLRRLFAAFLAFNAAEYATWIAILLFAYEATGPASVGVVAMLQLVPAALIAPTVAALGDQYPRDRVLSLDRRTPAAVQAMALLRRVGLFAPLPAPALEAIIRRATWETVPQGATVIREGDVGDRYFVLASGAVLVERDGRQLRELATPGDGFGEIALLRDVPRTATVTAMEASTFLTVDRQAFLAAVTGNPRVLARAESVVGGATM